MELSQGARLRSRQPALGARHDPRQRPSAALERAPPRAIHDGLIRISITADRAKYKNLVRDPWAALHITAADF